jgi:hypothetical protein
MVNIELLEYGYSFETEKHFIKFLLSGLSTEYEKKMINILPNITEGNVKRFEVEKTEAGLVILERFPEEQYPFHKEIPTTDEIKKVKKTVEVFIKPSDTE